MTDNQTYLAERALVDRSEAYRQHIAAGRNYLTKEEAAHQDYAAVDNAMRGRVEQFELLRDLPDRFTAYMSGDDSVHGRVTIGGWTAEPLGAGVVHSIGPSRGWAGERQRYGRVTIGGKHYAFQGPGSGMYCRLRALKDQSK